MTVFIPLTTGLSAYLKNVLSGPKYENESRGDNGDHSSMSAEYWG